MDGDGHGYGTLAAVVCELARSTPAPIRPKLRRIALRLGAFGGLPAAPSRSELFDLAATLLEVADDLARRGRHLEAFALEGVQGRLMEEIVGSGRHDVPLRLFGSKCQR